jgi:hypothetical protein
MMDFIDQISAVSTRIAATKHLIQTEEATKNAMIMPFIQALGYNVFDPTEVTPELISDIGTKKGEKVDYAILKDNKPIILFECKKCGNDLNINHASQLFRYFHVTEARFGVLTNGTTYHFFTDLDQPNKMDEKPFLEFNILDFKEQDIIELKKFTKIAFDIETILTTANELKYTRAIQNELSSQMAEPTEDFVKLIAAEFISGKRFTAQLKGQFTQITKRAFQQLINDRINERLKVAMTPDNKLAPIEIRSDESDKSDTQITTTPEEIEGYFIIKSILRDLVPSKRITMRDAQSYCAILLDDNNRKPICRLRFNNLEKLSIGIMNGKEEEKIQLSELDDIYLHAGKIRSVIEIYTTQT